MVQNVSNLSTESTSAVLKNGLDDLSVNRCTVNHWEVELQKQGDVVLVTDIFKWMEGNLESAFNWKWNHITWKEALEQQGMMQKVPFYLNKDRKSLHSRWVMGREMVGHPEIVHGGAIAFAFDETFGVLFACQDEGSGFTANLNIDYRKPWPAGSSACLFAEVKEVIGRKVHMKAILSDSPNGVIFAEAKCLFLMAKKKEHQP